jgi:L-lactate dehydrogenase (cytochrome)
MSTLNIAPVTTEDYRRIAEKRLPRVLFDYIDGGSFDERTLGKNVEDFQRIQMKQRVMYDVSSLDTRMRLFDEDWTMPVALAPIGLGGLMARRAETQAKRAADAFGIPMCLSTVSVCSMEEVAAVSDKPFWFQLYMLRDRDAVTDLLQRARNVGVTTLVFTIDLAVLGARYKDVRNGLAGNPDLWGRLRSGPLSYLTHPRWTYDVGVRGGPHVFGNLSNYVSNAKTVKDYTGWIHSQHDPSVTWEDIEWLRAVWDGKLVLKGILCPEDAISAANAGADAIIVSNHGGRQLDGVSSGIDMLPRVMDALDKQVSANIDVLVDGGVRNGQDVVKALALGAKATLIGRSWIYAVAASGERGLEDFLGTMKRAMETSMALTGAPTIEDITRDVLDLNHDA